MKCISIQAHLSGVCLSVESSSARCHVDSEWWLISFHVCWPIQALLKTTLLSSSEVMFSEMFLSKKKKSVWCVWFPWRCYLGDLWSMFQAQGWNTRVETPFLCLSASLSLSCFPASLLSVPFSCRSSHLSLQFHNMCQYHVAGTNRSVCFPKLDHKKKKNTLNDPNS